MAISIKSQSRYIYILVKVTHKKKRKKEKGRVVGGGWGGGGAAGDGRTGEGVGHYQLWKSGHLSVSTIFQIKIYDNNEIY